LHVARAAAAVRRRYRDYYAEDGSLRPTAATAEALLLQALKLQPHHLHALHLHIHSEYW
jgi:hypothetical protein